MKLNVRLTPCPARKVWWSRWITPADIWLEIRIEYHKAMSRLCGVVAAFQELAEWAQTDHVTAAVKLARTRRPVVNEMFEARRMKRVSR